MTSVRTSEELVDLLKGHCLDLTKPRRMNLQRHAKTKRASNLLCDENTTRPAAKKTMTVVDSENDGKVPTNISRWYGETRDTSQVKIRRLY
jgi:hypothetical protein